LKLSSLRESEPQGTEEAPAGGGKYLNAVAEIVTELEPLELLERCLEIEASLGRVRTARNAPRPIDIDVLLYGDGVYEIPAGVGHPSLCIPHPRMLERAFVLEPLAELAPLQAHPLARRTFTELWSDFQSQARKRPPA
jgi:2-amino-4-hydroxy-6-hydroxymethyldihydropteridine diphosphokinase